MKANILVSKIIAVLIVVFACFLIFANKIKDDRAQTKISLFDVASLTVDSDQYKSLFRDLNFKYSPENDFDLVSIREEFGVKAQLVKSEILPISLIIKSDKVFTVRVGDVFGFAPKRYEINDVLKNQLARELSQAGVYVPYETLLIEDVDSAKNALNLPYSRPVSKSFEDGVTRVDFTNNEKGNPYPVILYFCENGRLVGLDIKIRGE